MDGTLGDAKKANGNEKTDDGNVVLTTAAAPTATSQAAAATSRRARRRLGVTTGRRRKPQEYLMADGRRVLVALPEDVDALREKYARVPAGEGGGQVEVVVHGSAEHQQYLQASQGAQQARRDALRAQHGAAFLEEWDAVTADLDRVTEELAQLADHSASLGENFSKFGYSATLRTFGGGEGGGGGGSRHMSRTTSRANSVAGSEDEGGSDNGSGEGGGGGGGGGDGGGHDGVPMWHDEGSGESMKLFRRPMVKQYFHRGLLWRASEQTEVQSFELFFDLMYVGIIAINGDHAAESADGFELLRFLVTFCLSWKIWSDVTQLVSWFDTNDVVHRVEVLFLFSCLLAVTVNMTQTFGGWGSGGEAGAADTAGEATEGSGEAASAVTEAVLRLFRREETSTEAAGDTYAALAAYYVTARLFIALYCAVTGVLVPLVQGTMACQAVIAVIGAALWIASIHLAMPVRLACVFVALAFDLFGGTLVVGAFRFATAHAQSRVGRALLERLFDFYPAINIEHKVERTNAFMTLVLGYSVVGVLFQNSHGYALHAFLGKAVLGLVQAFIFNWIYFDVDNANIHVHAIRRGAETAWLWQYAHLLFTLAFILSSAGLSRLVVATDCRNAPLDTLTEAYQEKAADSVSLGLRLYYSTGLGISLAAYALIAASHQHKASPRCRIPKRYRLANRLAVAAIFCALPAAQHLSSLQLVSIATGLIVWVLVVEVYGTSCRGDSFIDMGTDGHGPHAGGSARRYIARCSQRRLEEALRAGRTGGDVEQPEVDINVLRRGEKHGAALME